MDLNLIFFLIAIVMIIVGGVLIKFFGFPHTSGEDSIGNFGKLLMGLGMCLALLTSFAFLSNKINIKKCEREPELEMCKSIISMFHYTKQEKI